MRRSLIAGALLMAACSPGGQAPPPEPDDQSRSEPAQANSPKTLQRFSYGGQSFTVPAQDISVIRTVKGKTFIRLKLPDHPADIVFDEASEGQISASGVPIIFSINDRDYPRIEYTMREGGSMVICRFGMAAQSGCGTKFDHAGVELALLFPLSKLDDADSLVAEARRWLDRHNSANALRAERD